MPRLRIRQSTMPNAVWVLAAIAFCVALGYGIVAPAIPGYAREFGVGRTLAALVISVFAFTRLLMGFGGAKVVDRFGATHSLGVGIGITAVTSIGAGLAQTYWQLLLMRGIGGFGSAVFTIAAMKVITDQVPNHIRGRAMGVYSGGFLFGGIAGPVLGGPLTAVSSRIPFFFYGLMLGVAVLVTYVWLPRTTRVAKVHDSPDPQAKVEPTEGVREAFRDKLYVAAAISCMASHWSGAVRTATIPLYVVEALRHGPEFTGLALTVFAGANALALSVAGRMSDNWGRRPTMLVGAALTTIGLSLLIFPVSLPLFFLSMVIGGFGASLQMVAPSAVAGDVAVGRKSSVLAAYGMAGDLGFVFGPILVNLTVDLLDFSWAFAVSAIVGVLAFIAALVAREQIGPAPAPTRRDEPTSEPEAEPEPEPEPQR